MYPVVAMHPVCPPYPVILFQMYHHMFLHGISLGVSLGCPVERQINYETKKTAATTKKNNK